MPNCDWGRPCDCTECSERRHESTCHLCNEKATKFITKYITDRKGIGDYYTKSLCNIHYLNELQQQQKRDIEIKKREDERKKLIFTYMEKFNNLEIEYIPIKNLYNKLYSTKYRPRNNNELIKKYPMLKIKKINGRWKCCKNALELMNFTYYNNISGWLF